LRIKGIGDVDAAVIDFFDPVQNLDMTSVLPSTSL